MLADQLAALAALAGVLAGQLRQAALEFENAQLQAYIMFWIALVFLVDLMVFLPVVAAELKAALQALVRYLMGQLEALAADLPKALARAVLEGGLIGVVPGAGAALIEKAEGEVPPDAIGFCGRPCSGGWPVRAALSSATSSGPARPCSARRGRRPDHDG